MVQIDIPMCMAYGATVAALASRQIKGEQQERHRIYYAASLLQGLVITPLIVYYLVRFPAWDTMYFLPDGWVTTKIVLLVAAASFCSFFLGYHFASRWAQKGRAWKAYLLAAFCWGLVAAVPLALFDRFIHLGTAAQYNAGQEMLLIYLDPAYVSITAVAGLALLFGVYRLFVYVRKEAISTEAVDTFEDSSTETEPVK